MRTIVVADGAIGPATRALVAAGEGGAPYVIAADGGARKAAQLGLVPHLLIGDGDSLSDEEIAALRAAGTEVVLFPAEKDESDAELALREAIARGGDPIIVVGALGGTRFDHAWANVTLLAIPELDGREALLADGATTVHLVGRADGPGELRLEGAIGDFVSLFPLDPAVDGIVTRGLRYPLDREALVLGPSRGLSNELIRDEAMVTTRRGRLIAIHTRGQEGGART
jgi:thiamine pyrophosphokinase